ncbi:geranylgeranylglyceryl/heptaprenylglyceryl phosphate synthase [Salinimicrobium soli]|uniref:geranylgeranylglyceryl/heptaprenylglyceryl phosphate synthase n=1 Tax=Salinimicrobium soli TaxID=1254399 RepID=UPI003AAB6ED2
MRFLKAIKQAVASREKMLAVLIDPDKFDPNLSADFLRKLPKNTTHILIGGSTDANGRTETCVKTVKAETSLPVILFPGDHTHITAAADAILFLSLLSGRNPEYLIGQQIKSVGKLRNSNLEIIPTGYILIDGGKESAVQRVSGTSPISQQDPNLIIDTALTGKFSGKKLIYLEAGSGALQPVHPEIISAVKTAVQIPVIVGGGIRTLRQLEKAYAAGADMVVVGTAFEKGEFFSLKNKATIQDF